MTMGVYAIRNVVTGDRYVGSSIDIERRVNDHVHRLTLWAKRGYKGKFIAAWQEYGQDAFEVDVLEEHNDIATMREREQWILAHESCVYNKRIPRGPSPLRINYPRTEEAS